MAVTTDHGDLDVFFWGYMSPQDLVPISNICQSCTVFISLIAYVPQWLVLCRNKSSESQSLGAWLLWLFSILLIMRYRGKRAAF
jgi:hypothetical protein